MTTFQVSDVEAVRTPVNTALAVIPIHVRSPRVEAFACSVERLVDGPLIHPLWLAFHRAFEEHRPVVLRPDDVWIAIAQGIGAHVSANAEALRSRLVRHEGKVAIEVRRDEFRPGDASNDWAGAVSELAAGVREHIGGRADLFVCDFSTTGPFERTASETVLLQAMASYFEYTVSTLCGIPEVTLEGTPDDWADVRRRARVIGELEVPGALDVHAWARALDAVLEAIEESARGAVDRQFWRRAYKIEHASGGDLASGWLNVFFPYVARSAGPLEINVFALEPLRETENFEGHLLSSYPDGLTQTPFTWKVLDVPHAMELWAGPLGVAQDEGTGALRVAYGWAVVPARPKTPFLVRPATSPWPSRLRVPTGASELASLEALALHADLENAELWLSGCTALVDLHGIEHLRRVTTLDLTGCASLRSLEALRGRRELEYLTLTGCRALDDLGPLSTLEGLRYLCLMDCTSVTDLTPLRALPKLENLVLWRCPAVSAPQQINHRYRDDVVRVLDGI